MLEARDPDAMSVQELRDEVWFWRTEAAADLAFRIGEFRQGGNGAFRTRGALRARIEGLVSLLGQALSGKVHDTCFACGEAIRPGDACLSDVNEGEMHAQCPQAGRPVSVKPGDKVFMDAEAIVWEGEGPKPDHLVAHAATRLYTTARIAERVGDAWAALAGSKAA